MCIISPLFIIVFLPIFVMYSYAYRKYIPAARDANRLQVTIRLQFERNTLCYMLRVLHAAHV